jgi:hypothetical protein
MSLLQFTPIIRVLREMWCYNLELQLERQLDRARAPDLVLRNVKPARTTSAEPATTRIRSNPVPGQPPANV